MEILERMLARCIEHQHHRAIPLSTTIIQAKSKSLCGLNVLKGAMDSTTLS
jgi:hypothetical protein